MKLDQRETFFALLFCLLLFLASSLGLFTELQALGLRVTDLVFGPVVDTKNQFASTVRFWSDLQNVERENTDLRSSLVEVEAQVSNLEDLQVENRWLRSQLNLKLPRPSSARVLSRVVRYQYTPSAGYIFIDNGGVIVKAGDWATVSGYLVGKVVEVMNGFSKVRLISANESSIPVRIGKNAVGILKGDSGVRTSVSEVSGSIAKGDKVRLLNPENVELESFIFAKIEEVTSMPADATQTAGVTGPIDLSSLSFVILVRNET